MEWSKYYWVAMDYLSKKKKKPNSEHTIMYVQVLHVHVDGARLHSELWPPTGLMLIPR
jgi:hypothetical protein